jgi:hypothetical protein
MDASLCTQGDPAILLRFIEFFRRVPRRYWQALGIGTQALLTGVAIGLLLYTGVEIGLSYLRNYEFEQAVRKEAQLAAGDSRPADRIQDDLLEKSQDLGLAIRRESITIVAGQQQAQIPIAAIPAIVANQNQNEFPTVGSVNIDVSYAVPIALPLYTLQLKFHCHGDEHTI